MKSIKVLLSGIVLILASLFCMGIVILNHGSGPDGLALGLFILGIIVCVIGLLFVKDNNEDDEDGESDDE